MKNQTTKRATFIAALSILAAIIGIALSVQHENGDVFVEIKPIPTPKATNMISSTPLPSPAALPSPTPEATLQPTCPSAATPAPVQGGKAFFTLSILNDTISVAYGVEESTLKKTPGWLTTSVLPGENGMCVVYGHRNRNHLKVLEKVTMGDTITATKDGIAYICRFRCCHIRKHIGLAAPNAGRKYACACDLLPVQTLGTCAGQVYGYCAAC